MIEYELLKIIWWVLVGVLLIGFALTDGFDMGSMALMPFVGKDDNERRAAINTIAPHWEGNQVWFVTAGGALFAAWPMVYATAFSGMYWALLLVNEPAATLMWFLFSVPLVSLCSLVPVMVSDGRRFTLSASSMTL